MDIDILQNKHRDFLILLLAADLLFIILHILHYTTALAPSRLYALQWDQGYGEFYQYVKALWLGILCLVLFFRRRQAMMLWWSILAFYLLLDDSLQFHEGLAVKLNFHLNLPSLLFLSGEQVGELIGKLFIGGLILTAFFLTWHWSDARGRAFARSLLPYLGLLLFFGLVVDVINVALLNWPMYLIEDGGEMAALSLLLWRVWRLHSTLA